MRRGPARSAPLSFPYKTVAWALPTMVGAALMIVTYWRLSERSSLARTASASDGCTSSRTVRLCRQAC